MSDSQPLYVRTISMPPKRSALSTPNTRSAAKRAGGTTPAPVVPVSATGADEGSDDGGSGSDASVAEGSHANALVLSKIREALKELSEEDLQSLVKGTPVTRPLQLDDRAAATAALDLTVKEYLYGMFDDSTRKLYYTVALDPLNAEDAVWNRIFSGIRPSAPKILPDISVYAHNALLDWRPKKVTPDTVAAFRSRTKEATTDHILFKAPREASS